jgi:hypothetical protein
MELVKIIKFLGALLTIGVAVYSLLSRKATPERKRLILIFWLIGPPVYFYFEYSFQAPYLTPQELTRFKDLQGLASNIWAGVAAALALAYFKKE